MAEETTISTPTEAVVDTSRAVEPTETVDTSTAEPTDAADVAETETESAEVVGNTTEEPKLYAGKYKSVEELEKGYAESQKAFNKAAELEKKIAAMEQANAEKEQKAQMEALKQAQQRGFNSVEAQQIADKVQVAELELYANNLNLVNPQDYETVRGYLASYMQTGHKAYLEEAKRYFGSEFVEDVALRKNELQNRLKGEFDAKNKQLMEANEQKLADELKGVYGEFLTAIKEDEGVTQALQMFCNTGHIQSKEDMQVFVDLVGKIQSRAKEQAIKEYEAQKTIEATKQASQIEATGNAVETGDRIPTYAEFMSMSREDYDKAVQKYGIETIMNAK